MRGIVGTTVASLLLAGSALAASPMGQLMDIGGSVYVNRGEGFFPVQGSIELALGDRVMVGKDGSATITYYPSGCEVMLEVSSMTTIAAAAPCQGTGPSTSTQGATAAASESSNSSGLSTGAIVAGGVGVSAAVALAVVLGTKDDGDDDNGQSP